MNRENSTSYELEKTSTINRESSEKYRYYKYYNFDINDFSIYDIIIDTNKLNQYQVLEILTTSINSYFSNKSIK